MIESSASTSAVNVTRLIDDGPLTRFQIVTIICCALVSALDGIDTQSIGVAAPFIAEELGVKLAHFGPIFSSALVGATIGAATFGPLADRLGRKTLFIVALHPFRRLHDTDSFCNFRSDADDLSCASRARARWRDAVLYRADFGIRAGAAARHAGHAHVVGVSARCDVR